jgi:hypothetical protein
MLHPPYLEPLLEGLVASIGGVDVSLHAAALQALKDLVQAQERAAAGAAAAAAQAQAQAQAQAAAQAAAGASPAAAAAAAAEGVAAGQARQQGERAGPLVGQAFLQALAQALLAVWRRQARSARMSVPLIKTGKELLAKSSMRGLVLPDGSAFAAQVRRRCRCAWLRLMACLRPALPAAARA